MACLLLLENRSSMLMVRLIGKLANAESLDDIAKLWIVRYSRISLNARFWNMIDCVNLRLILGTLCYFYRV